MIILKRGMNIMLYMYLPVNLIYIIRCTRRIV